MGKNKPMGDKELFAEGKEGEIQENYFTIDWRKKQILDSGMWEIVDWALPDAKMKAMVIACEYILTQAIPLMRQVIEEEYDATRRETLVEQIAVLRKEVNKIDKLDEIPAVDNQWQS